MNGTIVISQFCGSTKTKDSQADLRLIDVGFVNLN